MGNADVSEAVRLQLVGDIGLKIDDKVPVDWQLKEQKHNDQLDEVELYVGYGSEQVDPMMNDEYSYIPGWAWDLAAYRMDHADQG